MSLEATPAAVVNMLVGTASVVNGGLCRYGGDASFMSFYLHECGIHTN
jgi:hypothetical protein